MNEKNVSHTMGYAFQDDATVTSEEDIKNVTENMWTEIKQLDMPKQAELISVIVSRELSDMENRIALLDRELKKMITLKSIYVKSMADIIKAKSEPEDEKGPY